MAKKKVTKKKVVKEEESGLSKLVAENEDKQLMWFFIVVGVVFAMVLISYFLVEGAKSFEYVGADWVIEEYAEPTGMIYHGRFLTLDGGRDLNYNIYLRGDPRENDVPTRGIFDKFKHGGVVSISPEVDNCRGELSRVMLDLGAFLQQGVGVGPLSSGSTDEFVAIETDRIYAQCNTASDKTIVIVDIGESSVVQDEGNSYCYIINAEDCNDLSSVEKFMLKTIGDFGGEE
jgi:hypothetical protein